MSQVTAPHFRRNMTRYLDMVTVDRMPLRVTRHNAEPMMVIAESEWRSIQETLYLLSSPANNAQRLLASIADADAGRCVERELPEYGDANPRYASLLAGWCGVAGSDILGMDRDQRTSPVITRLGLKDFKNFANAKLKLGKFTVILGTNASGKSNIRDAFRFLHGVGRGYTFAEIFGGKWGSGGQREWVGIRGAMNEIVRHGEFNSFLEVTIQCTSYGVFNENDVLFSFEISRNGRYFHSIGEEFLLNGNKIFSPFDNSGNIVDQHYDKLIKLITNNIDNTPFNIEIPSTEPALKILAESSRVHNSTSSACKNMIEYLESIRFFEFYGDLTRQSSPPGQTTLGDHGENLPTVLQAICDDPARKDTLMEWVRALTPMDVTDFKFRTDLNGFVQLYLVESDGTQISAVSASDGTLRFLALLAALLGPKPAKLYFFEEIESGIHPARLHLLIDMLERQTAKSGIQVVTTTHSPELLSLLSDETLKSTSIVYRPPGRSDAIIKAVLDFPNIEKLRASQGLGRLHAAGWFEDVLAATLDDKGDAA